MARPNKKLAVYWRKQMEYADLVWEEAGWKASAKLRNPEPEQLATAYLDAYRGRQWGQQGWMGLLPEQLAVTPLFFSAANTFVAGLIARSPEISVLPRRPQVAEAARKVEAVLNYDVYELKMKRQWKRAVFDAFFCPYGIIRHGFTPSEEFASGSDGDLLELYAGARRDKPWIRRWTLWDFRLDPMAETPDSDGDAEWCAFRTMLTREQIENNPKMTLPKSATGTLRLAMPTPRGTLRTERESAPPEEYFEVWSIYNKCDKTWLQMDGTYEHILRPEGEWPIPWEDLPFDSLYFNPQADTPFPIPFAQTVMPAIVMRNKLRTITEELIKRIRRVIPFNENVLGEGVSGKLEDLGLAEFLPVKGEIGNAIGQVQLGSFPQELLLYDALLKEDVREALGQSNLDRGQRINVESAQEAAGVRQGSATNASRNVEALEDFLDSSIRHYAQARRATTLEDEIVPILGSEDSRILVTDLAQKYLTVTPADLNGEYDFIIKQGSTLPDTQARRVQEALGDVQVASQFPAMHNMQEVLASYWRARGKSVPKMMLNDQQLKQTLPTPVPGAEPGESGGVDNSQLIQSLGQIQ
jgi:hypothetical protein